MAENYGGDYFYDVLTNDSNVTSKVGTWTDSTDTLHPSIHMSRLVPQIDGSDNTINFYRTGNVNSADNFFQTEWSVDCRAKEEYTALDIATAVRDAINRNFASVGGKRYFSTVAILPAIEPADDADVYNVPVTVTLRRK